jgi:hypothetical protein
MKLVCTLLVAGACALSFVPISQGAIFNDPRIDQVATDVAGFRMRALCYTSFDTWRHDWDQDENRTMFGAASGGRGQFAVFLSPTACSTLLAALDRGPTAAGTRWGALAILTLLHVSIYQGNVERGLVRGWRYEGVTSCAALKLLPQYTTRFGFPEKIDSGSWKAVKKRGKIVKWRWVVKQVPNPAYSELLAYASEWHRFLFGADCR